MLMRVHALFCSRETRADALLLELGGILSMARIGVVEGLCGGGAASRRDSNASIHVHHAVV